MGSDGDPVRVHLGWQDSGGRGDSHVGDPGVETAMSRMEPIMPQLRVATPPQGATRTQAPAAKVSARAISVFYGDKQALFDVSLDMPEKSRLLVVAIDAIAANTTAVPPKAVMISCGPLAK